MLCRRLVGGIFKDTGKVHRPDEPGYHLDGAQNVEEVVYTGLPVMAVLEGYANFSISMFLFH